MTISEDGFYLVEEVRKLVTDRPLGVEPWRGAEILGLIQRAEKYAGDHERFYLAFLDGVRDLIGDDEDAVLTRFMRQAVGSEARSLADAETDRDHLTHVTQVYLVGWLILNSCQKFRRLEGWHPYDWKPEERFDLLNRGWIFTSLLHDCAYSAQNAFRGREHEVRVRAMFGKMYRPGTAGGVEKAHRRKVGKALWARRCSIIHRPITPSVQDCLDILYCHEEYGPDHAFVTAQALMTEAEHHPSARKILEIGAVSLVTHNFRQQLQPGDEVAQLDVVEWLAVDFWDEPLAALVTVADEIQEWGRERGDLARTRESAVKDFMARTVLTHLSVDDAEGLRIRAELNQHLFPEDRANRTRLARNREVDLAKINRSYVNAFRPRVTEHTDFHLHLRIDEAVEGVPCGVARRFDWPVDATETLAHRSAYALKDGRRAPSAFQAMEVELRASQANEATTLLELDTSGRVKLHDLGSPVGIRVVVVAAGGAGKSTLLRQLATTEKLGRRPLLSIYVEELDERLTDLEAESVELRGDSGKDVLLIVDHLDRVLRTPNETYWFEQLKNLSRESWIHVICACRPEEFEGVVHFALGKEFVKAEPLQRVGLLMEDVDVKGRVTALGIERRLKGTSAELDRLGQLALSMKERRFIERPALVPAAEATFADELVVSLTAGRLRFIHDAIQDFLSARALARDLARSSAEPPPRLSSFRRLLECPPDVFRLLLDLIVHSKRLDRAERSRAAEGLGHALLHEPTVRHWLYDMGHLRRAEEAVAAFADAFEAQPRVAFVTQMLEGLVAFGQFTPTKLELGEKKDQREEHRALARRSAVAFSRSLAKLNAVEQEAGETNAFDDETEQDEREVLAIDAADHLATTLARVALLDSDRAFVEELRRVCLSEMELVKPHRAGDRLTPGWAKEVVEGFNVEGDPIAALVQMDEDLSTRAKPGTEQARRLAKRRYGLAGHIGGTLFLRPTHDADSLGESFRWQERAISRAMRVLRLMETSGERYEQYGTKAHCLIDAARNHGAIVYLWACALHVGTEDRTEGQYRLLDAFGRFEGASRAAKLALRPGERLSTANWHTMQDQVFGAVFRDAFFKGGMSIEEAMTALERQREKVDDYNRRYAQLHGRQDGTGIFDYLRSRIGDPAEFVARHAEPV